MLYFSDYTAPSTRNYGRSTVYRVNSRHNYITCLRPSHPTTTTCERPYGLFTRRSHACLRASRISVFKGSPASVHVSVQISRHVDSPTLPHGSYSVVGRAVNLRASYRDNCYYSVNCKAKVLEGFAVVAGRSREASSTKAERRLQRVASPPHARLKLVTEDRTSSRGAGYETASTTAPADSTYPTADHISHRSCPYPPWSTPIQDDST
jgi:hypothetical protein